MKKRIVAVILIMVLMTVGVSASSNKFELEQVFYPIYSDGKLVPEDELPTLSYNDRTYVPLRKLSEATGLGVGFNDEKQTINIANTPLDMSQVYAFVTDSYYDIHNLYDYYEDCGDMMRECTTAVIEGDLDYAEYLLEALPEYIEVYIPAIIESLKKQIGYIEPAYVIYGLEGENPTADLKDRLEKAESLLQSTKLCREYLLKFVTGEYSYDRYSDLVYGSNKDGMFYVLSRGMNNMIDKVLAKYDYYFNLLQAL